MSPAGGCAGPVDGVGVLCMHDAAPAGLEGFRSGRGSLLPRTAHLTGVTMSASALLGHCALGVRHEGTRLDVGPFLAEILKGFINTSLTHLQNLQWLFASVAESLEVVQAVLQVVEFSVV